MTDLADWLRSTLDDLAAGHRRAVERDATQLGVDPAEHAEQERADDPDGFWALWDAHDAVFTAVLTYEAQIDGEQGCLHDNDQIAAGLCPKTPTNEIAGLRALALAYQHADGYREEWRP